MTVLTLAREWGLNITDARSRLTILEADRRGTLREIFGSAPPPWCRALASWATPRAR
jgi:hypothetical protein